MKTLDEKYMIVKEDNQCLFDILTTEPLMKFILGNKECDSNISRAFLSNIAPFGEEIAIKIIKQFSTSDYQDHLLNLFDKMKDDKCKPITYLSLSEFGYPFSEKGSAYKNILNKIKSNALTDRGISDQKKFNINFNILSEYLQKRMTLIHSKEGFAAYDYKHQKYIMIDKIHLESNIKRIVHEACPNIWISSYGDEILKQLRVDVPNYEQLSEDKNFLNLKNGLFNLKTMNLIPHTEKVITFIQLPVSYDVNAICPQFINFMNDIFEGDMERINLIQEIMGYCLTGETFLQKFFMFYGSGANGKSLLADIFRAVCGHDNCSSASLNHLNERFGAQSIINKRLNISSENENIQSFNTQLIKLITGEDEIQVERKYVDSYSFKPFVKLLVLSNSYINTDDHSVGFSRRCVMIPFNQTYVTSDKVLKKHESYRDETLKDKLMTELDGIFVWALEGYKRLIQNGNQLTRSRVCDEALKDYLVFIRPIDEFIEDCIEISPETRELNTDVIECFKNWCECHNVTKYKNLSAKGFWNLFKGAMNGEISIKLTKSNSKNYVCGIRLK